MRCISFVRHRRPSKTCWVCLYLNTTKLTTVLFCCLYGDDHQNNFLVCAKQFVGTIHNLLYFWYDIPIPYRTICIPILASRHRPSICLLRMTSRLAAQCTLGPSNHCAGACKVVSNSNVDSIQGDIHSWFTAVRNKYTLCWNCNSASVYHFAHIQSIMCGIIFWYLHQ